MVILAVATLSVILVLLAYEVFRERDRIVRGAGLDVVANGRQLAEHASKVLGIHGLVLQNAQWLLDTQGWTGIAGNAAVHGWLRDLASQAPEVQSYWLVDATGHVRSNSMQWPATLLDVRDRDYFQAHLDPRTQIYVGPRLSGRIDPGIFFTLGRRLTGPDGSFQGVAQVSLLPGYFEQFYRTVVKRGDTEILLIRASGELLARYPASAPDVIDIGSAASLLAAGGPETPFEAVSPLDGQRRIYARVPVDALPVQIVYGVSVAGIRQELWRRSIGHAAATLLAMALLGPLGLVALRRTRQAEAAHSLLRRSNQVLEQRVAERTAHLDRAMAELDSSRGRLTRLLDSTAVGILESDAEGRIIYANHAASVMLGLPRESIVGRRYDDPAWDIRRADGRPVDRGDLPGARALHGERVLDFEHTVRDPAGGPPLIFSVNAVPIHDGNGRVVGASVTLNNVTARHRAEEALRGQQTLLRVAQQAGGVGTWTLWPGAGRLEISPNMLSLYGLPPDHPVMPGTLLSAVHPDDAEEAKRRLQAAWNGETPTFDAEFRVCMPDGAVRWLIARAEVVRDADGQPLHVTGASFDITDRKLAEDRQKLLMREVDHRAKNALAVVQAIIRLTQADDIDAFTQAVEGRIAALSRAHSLLAQHAWSGADLSRLVQEELLPFAEPGQTSIEGPAVRIAADAVQSLGLILHELATNAAKHGALSCPEGRLGLRWTRDADGLHLDWQETGGPRVLAPQRRGFGTTLLERVLQYQLGGRMDARWDSGGLCCTLHLPPRVLA